MRTCHSVSLLLTSIARGVVFAESETLFGGNRIDKVENVVGGNIAQAGDLASVSLALQSLGVPHSGREINAANIMIDTYRLTSRGS